METKRNNRAYGEPLPVEPKRGKHRVKKDRSFCNRLKGEHSMVVIPEHSWPTRGMWWIRLECTACGHRRMIREPSNARLKNYAV